MDEDINNNSAEINDEKSNVPEVIKQISEIQLPLNILEQIDIKSIGQRFSDLFEDLDNAQENFKKLDNAGFLKKFWWAITGKTTNILLDAQQIQTELAKLQSMLILLNTSFAKELNRQQTLISNQQKIIEEQNQEIKNQQNELEQQNRKISETQETILKLIHLTKDQEDALKELLDKADYIKSVESHFNKEVLDIRTGIQGMKTEYEESNVSLRTDIDNISENIIKGLMIHLEDVNGEMSIAKENMESFEKLYVEDKRNQQW